MEWLNFIQDHSFYQLTALLMLAAIVGFIGLQLHQPLIVSFIAMGAIAGPSALGLVGHEHHIELLAELGIAVLLFLVGLKLDLKLVKTLGPVSARVGLAQVFLTTALGFGIAYAFGMPLVASIYIGIALAFSSTIIIVKMLSDKREIDSLHGRMSLGVLIVQDLVVVIVMMVLSALGAGSSAGEDQNMLFEIARVALMGVAMLVFVLAFIKYAATPLLQQIAKSPELLICFAIAWAALLASIGHYAGFSKELGGLLAGISLASTPYREAIISRLSSLRDFLLLFFFISLGSGLDIASMGSNLGLAVTLIVFVLLMKPIIIMWLMSHIGYRKRTGFFAGTMLGQISEFSLILMALGLSLGHVDTQTVGLVTLVGMVTIAISVYNITYSHKLYAVLEPYLSPFEKHLSSSSQNDEASRKPDGKYPKADVILFGIGRFGEAIAREVLTEGKKLLAVDFNPESVRAWNAKGLDAVYGDASDPEFLSQLPLDRADWVISALPQYETGVTHEHLRLTLIDGLKSAGYKGHIAVATHKLDEVGLLKAKGAELVLLPFQDAASRAVKQILA